MKNSYSECKVQKGCVFSVGGQLYEIRNIRNDLRLQPHGSKKDYPLATVEAEDIFDDNMDYYRLENSMYVLYRCELYPCFDSYDRQYENRYYRAYYLCETLDEVREKFNHLQDITDVNLNPWEEHRAYLAPYVYFDDDEKTFTVYEKIEA
jgi:hypothetical protein